MKMSAPPPAADVEVPVAESALEAAGPEAGAEADEAEN